jgi:hypothetical protein
MVPDCPVFKMRRQLADEGYKPAGQHAQMLANLGLHVEPAVARCMGFHNDDRQPVAELVNFAPTWALRIAQVSPSRWPLKERKRLIAELMEGELTVDERDDLIAVAVAAHTRKGRR